MAEKGAKPKAQTTVEELHRPVHITIPNDDQNRIVSIPVNIKYATLAIGGGSTGLADGTVKIYILKTCNRFNAPPKWQDFREMTITNTGGRAEPEGVRQTRSVLRKMTIMHSAEVELPPDSSSAGRRSHWASDSDAPEAAGSRPAGALADQQEPRRRTKSQSQSGAALQEPEVPLEPVCYTAAQDTTRYPYRLGFREPAAATHTFSTAKQLAEIYKVRATRDSLSNYPLPPPYGMTLPPLMLDPPKQVAAGASGLPMDVHPGSAVVSPMPPITVSRKLFERAFDAYLKVKVDGPNTWAKTENCQRLFERLKALLSSCRYPDGTTPQKVCKDCGAKLIRLPEWFKELLEIARLIQYLTRHDTQQLSQVKDTRQLHSLRLLCKMAGDFLSNPNAVFR